MGTAETYIEQVSYEHGLNSIRSPHLGSGSDGTWRHVRIVTEETIRLVNVTE